MNRAATVTVRRRRVFLSILGLEKFELDSAVSLCGELIQAVEGIRYADSGTLNRVLAEKSLICRLFRLSFFLGSSVSIFSSNLN